VLSPAYAKAYSRLGLSSFFLGRYEESVDAYERAVELEPDNKQSQDSLKSARNKLKKANKVAHPDAPSSAAEGMPDLSSLMGSGGGMPDMSHLLSNPKYKDAYDKAGGASGIANLMKDPKMMAMAQEMMKNPAMMQQAMQMMGGGGGGGGGMPDMSALMNMMGGGGAAAPSSSSGTGKKFKGFEE
jgi:small glutamine-rich tetratricopeptide repeat-containing protein alpha